MRHAFFDRLARAAVKRKEIFVLTADLGFKLFDTYRKANPEGFLNTGVAEANMVGLASGLAIMGRRVYCYSIIPFLTMRAYEQVRLDVAYEQLPVTLVGVGAGFNYGREGFTHHAIEDLALLRAMPGMSVVAPADAREAALVAAESLRYGKPLYVRLGNNRDPLVHEKKDPAFRIGKGIVLKAGRKVLIFGIGNLLVEVKNAAELLKRRGITPTIVNLHTLKPVDQTLIAQLGRAHEAVFTVEEHSITGGLGSAVSEVLCETGFRGIFKRIGIEEPLRRISGQPAYLRRVYGLTADLLAQKILRTLKQRN
jgi:transketolase